MGYIKPIKIPRNVKPEDRELYLENLEARKRYDVDGCRALIAAVCMQAIRDYKNAKSPKTRASIRPFFTDWMFSYFTNGQSAEEVIKAINKIPKNIAATNIMADKQKRYIVKKSRTATDAQFQVWKDGKFVAGYKCAKSAKILADDINGEIREFGKTIYSKTLHLKGVRRYGGTGS